MHRSWRSDHSIAPRLPLKVMPCYWTTVKKRMPMKMVYSLVRCVAIHWAQTNFHRWIVQIWPAKQYCPRKMRIRSHHRTVQELVRAFQFQFQWAIKNYWIDRRMRTVQYMVWPARIQIDARHEPFVAYRVNKTIRLVVISMELKYFCFVFFFRSFDSTG